MIKVKHQLVGSNVTHNPLTIETRKVYNGGTSSLSDVSSGVNSDLSEDLRTEEQSSSNDGEPKAIEEHLTDTERRAKRKQEYRDAALIRERAIQMEKKASERIEQTREFYALMQSAKEDPLILAKALNITPDEFQRKIFNKSFSIKEDPIIQKEETFEEQTKRKLAEYEQERAADKERRTEEIKRNSEEEFQKTKHRYIQDNILPGINESHEFIHRNDKYSCAALVYDLMNQAYQDHLSKGGSQDNFTLKSEDVVDQMEEELEKRAAEQISEARNINKLKKYFGNATSAEDRRSFDNSSGMTSITRKDFGRSYERSSPTLSHSLGSSVSPSIALQGRTEQGIAASAEDRRSFTEDRRSFSSKRIPLKDRASRLEAAKRNLGS